MSKKNKAGNKEAVEAAPTAVLRTYIASVPLQMYLKVGAYTEDEVKQTIIEFHGAMRRTLAADIKMIGNPIIQEAANDGGVE